MSFYEPDLTMQEGPTRQHVAAAIVACILSVGLHIVGLIYLSDVKFDVATVTPDMMRARESRTMRVEPPPANMALAPSRPEPLRPGDAAFLVDPATDASLLATPPDKAAIEPPAISENHFSGEEVALSEPEPVLRSDRWEPRQEILAIEKRIAVDALATIDRRFVPRVERAAVAPDVTLPALDRATMIDNVAASRVGSTAAGRAVSATPAPAEMPQLPRGTAAGTEAPAVQIDEPEAISASELFQEDRAKVTPFKPIEKLLTARMTTFAGSRDREYGYFKIEIDRAGADVLPVLPKDFVFMQDCSSSISEQRLPFCREGLLNALPLIGSQDRFNIIRFSDKSELCFPEWATPTPQNLAAAKAFVGAMRASGETDIFASIRRLLELTRTPGRPVIALLVTDGRSTTGITESSNIIGEFSKLNDGAVSVMTMGTQKSANRYLLDLLSYCNRGTSYVETKGRWEIPASMPGLAREVSRPVLSDVRFLFAAGGGCEVYPRLTTNLYLDRSLELYGRYKIGTPSAVFQAVGRAGDTPCDMVFDVALGTAPTSRDESIRAAWAAQKVYYLIGQYARTPRPEIMREITQVAREYDIDVPHRGLF